MCFRKKICKIEPICNGWENQFNCNTKRNSISVDVLRNLNKALNIERFTSSQLRIQGGGKGAMPPPLSLLRLVIKKMFLAPLPPLTMLDPMLVPDSNEWEKAWGGGVDVTFFRQSRLIIMCCQLKILLICSKILLESIIILGSTR